MEHGWEVHQILFLCKAIGSLRWAGDVEAVGIVECIRAASFWSQGRVAEAFPGEVFRCVIDALVLSQLPYTESL